MKKLLSILLALLLLGMSLAVGAAAAPEVEINPHNLVFELPVVTGIEAVWNGEVLLDSELRARFTPENVDVTVRFEDGSSELLTIWSAEGWGPGRWWWNVFYRIEGTTVTFFYDDSNIQNAYLEESGLAPWDIDWAAYRAALQQDSFTFPANYLEMFMDAARPIAALTLNEAATVAGSTAVFSFTPEASRRYHFSTNGWHVTVANADLERLGSSWRDFTLALTAGETYYVFALGPADTDFTVTVSDEIPRRERLPVWLDVGLMVFGAIVVLPALVLGIPALLWFLLSSLLFWWL